LVQIFSSTPSVYIPPLLSETMFHTNIEPSQVGKTCKNSPNDNLVTTILILYLETHCE
jgi:hypothetical protein